MIRFARNPLVPGAIAAVLVAVVLLLGRRDYLREPPTLTAIDPAAVTRVELELPQRAPWVFERGAQGWRRSGSAANQADAARAERLAMLAATPVVRWLPASARQSTGFDRERPLAVLVLNGTRLEYGGFSAIDNLRYVRVGERLALVAARYSPEAVPTPDPIKGTSDF